MIDDRERSAFAPRLPQDPAYWHALAERVTASAEPVLAEIEARQAWWRPLDRFAPALAVGALAAAAATFVALPATEPPALPMPSTVAAANPTDLLENAFAIPQAPEVMALMVLGNEEQP